MVLRYSSVNPGIGQVQRPTSLPLLAYVVVAGDASGKDEQGLFSRELLGLRQSGITCGIEQSIGAFWRRDQGTKTHTCSQHEGIWRWEGGSLGSNEDPRDMTLAEEQSWSGDPASPAIV